MCLVGFVAICNKAIVDVILRLHCAPPSLPSRQIGRTTCAQNFPHSYLQLPGICMTLFAVEWSLLHRTCYSALSVGRKTPKIAPSPWDFVALLKDDSATAIGNKHIKIGKDRACGSGDILAYRQTDIHIPMTILRHRSCGRSNNHHLQQYRYKNLADVFAP